MTDAYQCDRCDEYNGGNGHPVRYGEYFGTNGFTGNSKYEFDYQAELCDDCKAELDALIDDFSGDADE